MVNGDADDGVYGDGDGDVGSDADDNDGVDVQEGGGTQDFTTITWQIGLGETLCYRFH